MPRKLERITDPDECQQLWKRCGMQNNTFGITGSFQFRDFYSRLFGMKPLFICDDLNNPSYLLPLSAGEGSLGYFGTTELEDTPVHVTKSGKDSFLRAIEELDVSRSLPKINATQLKQLQRLGVISSQEKTGIKVVTDGTWPIAGSGHFSARNMRRARQALSNLSAEWVIQENPSEASIGSVFDDSIAFFREREMTSKFVEASRRERYLKLFLASIPGVLSFIATCTIEDVPAINALFFLYKSVATISTIAVHPDHPQGKKVKQYGFRYATETLQAEISRARPTTVDFQGGDYSWKKEVNPSIQLNQFTAVFNE